MADYIEEHKETKRYRVAIVETLRKVVTVAAENEDEARRRVSDGWRNSEHILMPEHFEGAEFHVLGEAEDSDGEEADKK